MPAVNQQWGVVMWLPADRPDVPMDLFLVDLEAGWEAFLHSVWTHDWRKQTPMRALLDATPFPSTAKPSLEAQMEASVASEKARARSRHPASQEPRGSQETGTQPEHEAIVAYHVLRLRGWLQARVDVTGSHPQARTALMSSWPEGVPSLRTSMEHTFNDLSIIEQTLDVIDRVHSIPFPVARPVEPDDLAGDALALVVDLFPGATSQPTAQEPTP